MGSQLDEKLFYIPGCNAVYVIHNYVAVYACVLIVFIGTCTLQTTTTLCEGSL